jgi:hypothetical protein
MNPFVLLKTGEVKKPEKCEMDGVIHQATT